MASAVDLLSATTQQFDDDDDILSADGDTDSSSEEDGDEDEDIKDKQLLNAIGALDGRTKKRARSEPSQEVSVYNLNTSAVTGKKVRIHELLGTLKSTTSHGELKKQLQKIQKKNKRVETPLPQVQADRIERSLAYEKTTKAISKWEHVVQTNRRAEHLSYPLYEEKSEPATTENFVKNFKPGNSLEEEIYAVLHGSKFAERKDQELSLAEEEALKAMSVEEARERRKELQKMRALQSYYEAKCRRQKKIKSKKYHRIQRKARERQEKRQLEELERTDPEAYEQYVQKTEKHRAEERITLKHKNTGKWAKNISRYNKYNPESVKAVSDQLQKSKNLTTKIAETIESDSDREEMGAEDEDVLASVKPSLSDINNPWFSGYSRPGKGDEEEVSHAVKGGQMLQEIRAQHHDSESSDSEEEKDTSMTHHPKPTRKVRFFDEEQSGDENENEGLADAKKADIKPWQPNVKRKDIDVNDTEEVESSDSEIDMEDIQKFRTAVRSESKERTGESENDQKHTEEVHVDPSKFFTIEAKTIRSENPELAIVEDVLEEEEDQRLQIQEAFAEDDVVADFSREKRSKIEEDAPKELDLSLPGWGDWGGIGIVPSKKKKKRFTIKAAPQAPRKDRSLPNVIINENRDKMIAMHQVNALPFPYTSVQEFERSIRQPIGRTWNTESAFKKLTKPKVTTKLGTIIPPITAEEALENKKKTEAKQGRDITESGGMKLSDDQTKKRKRKQNEKKKRQKSER
ncbi:U3 small nucleolar RNA-associated protein 14 homolog A-like isoform X2 [Glandiceps talaboti]